MWKIKRKLTKLILTKTEVPSTSQPLHGLGIWNIGKRIFEFFVVRLRSYKSSPPLLSKSLLRDRGRSALLSPREDRRRYEFDLDKWQMTDSCSLTKDTYFTYLRSQNNEKKLKKDKKKQHQNPIKPQPTTPKLSLKWLF